MRKSMIAAASIAVLGAAAGLAFAQEGAHRGPPGGMIFQSDANNDGVVTRQEFDAGRDAMFTRLDTNHDNQLSREEMRAGWREHGGPDGHRGGQRGGPDGGHMLDRADANHDGNITREEFLAGPTAMFQRLDTNHDGVISAGERPQRSERGEHGPGDQAHQRANPDVNGDQQISRSEWTSMGASMFDRLDANHDGRVTRDEAAAAHAHRDGGAG